MNNNDTDVYATSCFLWVDSGVYDGDPIRPLAVDEALVNAMSRPSAQPMVHLWISDKALFLGRRDAKLPRLFDALHTFGQAGYRAVLRSSGGACVPLDTGVLNLAILLPDTRISIDQFFRLASGLLVTGLREYGSIVIGEVKGSYCAGDYDFAINGRKIGGMAQRRTKNGSILQLCINVEPSQRGPLMELFYRQAGLEEMEAGKPIPAIDGRTVTSLSEEAHRFVSVAEVKEKLFQALEKPWNLLKSSLAVTEEEIESSRIHLQEKLGLFSYTAKELSNLKGKENQLKPSWQPIEEDRSRT